jgi:hypothetical protein
MYKKLGILIVITSMVMLFSCKSQNETATSSESEARPVESGQSGPPQGNSQGGPEGSSQGSFEELGEVDIMFNKLHDFIRFEQNIPDMALTQEQKDSIIVVFTEWKEVLDSSLVADETLYVGQIASILTEEQNSYDPMTEENSQSGPPSGGQSGPPSGGQSGSSSGQSGPPSGGQGGPQEISTSDKLDMLIKILSGEQVGPMGPPPTMN